MNDLLATILKDTYSLTRFKDRIRLLKSHLLRIVFGGESENNPDLEKDKVELLENRAGLNMLPDETWLKSLPPAFYQKFTKDNIYDIFSSIEKSAGNLPVLTLFLPFEPNEATETQLGTMTRTTFNFPTLLLDIKLDPNLIAGTALSWKGVYKDYSLRARIAEKRSEISEGFRRFLR